MPDQYQSGEQYQTVGHFIDRLKQSKDELVIITTCHLLTEFIIDRIIEQKCIDGKKITENTNYTYSIKLTFLHSIGLIPEHLYKSLVNLNKIRNAYAHKLNPKPQSLPLKFYQGPVSGITNMPLEIVCRNPDNKDEYFEFLNAMCFVNLNNFTILAGQLLNVDIRIEK